MCTLGAVKPFALSLIYIIYTIAVNLTHTKTYFSYLSERTKKKENSTIRVKLSPGWQVDD